MAEDVRRLRVVPGGERTYHARGREVQQQVEVLVPVREELDRLEVEVQLRRVSVEHDQRVLRQDRDELVVKLGRVSVPLEDVYVVAQVRLLFRDPGVEGL